MAPYSGKANSYHTIEILPIFLLKMSLLQKITYIQPSYIKNKLIQLFLTNTPLSVLSYKPLSHSWYNDIMVNPLTPMSDHDRISPYNINAISTR